MRPRANANLRLAVDKAKEANMPKDNIERAINKGLGVASDGQSYEEVIYEGYGPSGAAFIVKAVTDNKNRTVAEIRSMFSRLGGSLGGAGSTSYIFGQDPENPSFTVEVGDPETAGKLERLHEELDAHDDVQEVYSNFSVVVN